MFVIHSSDVLLAGARLRDGLGDFPGEGGGSMGNLPANTEV